MILMGLLGSFIVPMSFSQEQNQSTSHEAVGCTLRLSTAIVVIEVEVLSTRGAYISGLGHEEFTVYENGEKQEISFFSDEEESDVANPRTKYTIGYYPPDLSMDGEPRRVRIKVRKWKSKGYEVRYSPDWYVPMFDEGKHSPTWYLPPVR